MIFRKVETDAKGFSNQLGIFGKSFANIKADLSSGQGLGFSLFSGNKLSSHDLEGLRGFSEEIKSIANAQDGGTEVAALWQKHMAGCSDAAIDAGIQIKNGTAKFEDFAGAQEKSAQSAALLTAKSMALNAGLSILASLIIKGAVWALDKLIDTTDECKERVDNLMSAFDSAISAANSNAQNVESLASRYETLSKGVDSLGNNISLTADEYSEYNNITAQIADMFPQLIQGYTDEGAAILSLKGNVEELRDAYKEAQKEAYNLLIASGEDGDGNDIIKNWNNLTKSGAFRTLFDVGKPSVGGSVTHKDAIADLDLILNSTYDEAMELIKHASLNDELDKLSTYADAYLQTLGLTVGLTEQEFYDLIPTLKATRQTLESEMEEGLNNVKKLANAYLMTNIDYEQFDEQTKKAVSVFVSSFDEEIASSFQSSSDVGAYVTNIIDKLKGNKELQGAITKLFTLDKEEFSAADYEKYVDSILTQLQEQFGLDDDAVYKIKLSLGFEFMEDGSTKVDTLVEQIQEKLQDEFDDRVAHLRIDDLVYAAKVVAEIPEGQEITWDELVKGVQKYKQELEQIAAMDAINKNLDDIQSAYSTLASARDEYNKYGAYSLDTVQALLSLEPKYLAMLVDENGQLVINEQAMKDLVNAQLEEAKANIYGSAIAELNALAEEKVGEASKTSAGKKSDSVIDIDAETDALGLNTEAAMKNAAAHAVEKGVTQEEADAIVKKYSDMANNIAKIVNGMGFDFSGVMSGFEDEDEVEKRNQAIDNFQSRLSTLSEAMQKFRKGELTSTDQLDLIQEFPELEGKVGDLDEAITALVEGDLQKLYDMFGDDIPDEFKQYLEEIKIEALNQEQLELANQELNIAKKQAEYDNRAKERDTQIILGNRVVNVADPEELYNIAKEKAALESNYNNTKKTYTENQTIRDMQSENDITKEQATAVQANVDMWNEATSAMQKAMYEFIPTMEELNAQMLSFATFEIPKFRDMVENGVRDLVSSMEVGKEIGIGTDVSVDNSQIVYDLNELVEKGIISAEYADYIAKLNESGDRSRKQKAAYDRNFEQYHEKGLGYSNEEFESDYHESDQQKQKRREAEIKKAVEAEDYQAAMNLIIDAARGEGREFTPSELEELKRLETARNQKIWDYGLNYAQIDDYGGSKFTTFVEGDYTALF